MRLILLFLVTFFYTSNLSASHLLGGDISWKFDSNGKATFTLTVLRDCKGIGVNINPKSISYPGGTITCNLKSQFELFSSCPGSVPSPCVNGGAIEVFKFTSDTVTLNGLPPANGWNFSWNDCCMTGGIQNIGINSINPDIYISAVMYQKVNSPSNGSYFQEAPIGSGYYTVMQYLGSQGLDSIRYAFTPVKVSAYLSIPLDSGYSCQQPFPNPSTDTLNGAVLLDNKTGLLQVNVMQADTGIYAYGLKVSSYNNGALASEIYLYSFLYLKNSPVINAAPVVVVDSQTSAGSSNIYEFELEEGDSLGFNIIAFDPDSIPQKITASCNSTLGSISQSGVFFPDVGQMGFIGVDTNKLIFSWAPKPGEYEPGEYLFNLEFRDSACPIAAKGYVSILIHLKELSYISQDTLNVCYGNGLNGTIGGKGFAWFPDSIVNNIHSKNPVVVGSTSQYLYMVDTASSGIIDSVWLDINGPIGLQKTGSTISVNATGYNNISWYLNGIPYASGQSVISVFADGNYYAKVDYGNCKVFTDTVILSNGVFLNIIQPSNGTLGGSGLSLDSSYGFSFNTDSHGLIMDQITLFGLVDSTETNDSISFNLFDNSGTLISSKVAIRVGYKVDFVFDTTLVLLGNDYKVSFTLHSPSSVKVYALENVNFPYQIGAMKITGAWSGTPQLNNSSPHLVPVYSSFDYMVGIKEGESSFLRIYPNPVNDQLMIEGAGLHSGTEIQVLDFSGKAMQTEHSFYNSKILVNTSTFEPGVYLMKVNEKILKFVKK